MSKTTVEKPDINTSLQAKYLAKRTQTIKGVVLHDTAGSGTHNDTRYLANPSDGRKVSVDFTVERDGSIWQLNPALTKFCCAHAGRHTKFKASRDAQVNHATVGIEIVQKANLSLQPLYTPEQVQAVAHLCAWLCQEFKLEPADITTHRNVITDGSRTDPRRFPFEGDNGFWYWFHYHRGNQVKFLSAQVEKPEHAPQPEFEHPIEPVEVEQIKQEAVQPVPETPEPEDTPQVSVPDKQEAVTQAADTQTVSKVSAAAAMSTLEVKPPEPTNFLSKGLKLVGGLFVGVSFPTLLAGIKDFIQTGNFNGQLALDLIKFLFPYLFWGGIIILVVWFVVTKANNFQLTKLFVQTNTNPEVGNVKLANRTDHNEV